MFDQNRTIKLLVAVTFCLMITATTAFAQTGLQNSPQAIPFTFNCDGQQVTVISPSNTADNALVLSNNSVLVATSAVLTETFASATRTLTFPFGAGHGQAVGVQASLITCTSQPFAIQDQQLGAGTATLALIGFLTPQ